MNNIMKMIYRKMFEITFCLIFVGVSYVIWEICLENNAIKMASIYEKSSYCYVNANKAQASLLALSDEQVNKHLESDHITLKRDTTYHSSYHVVLKINKNDIIDDSKIKIQIDNDIYYLQERFLNEDETSKYYLIEDGNLEQDSKEIMMKLWLDKDNSIKQQVLNYTVINTDNLISLL